MSDQEKIQVLLERLNEKDDEDFAHAKRVQTLVDQVLPKFDLTDNEKEDISTAAILHDIGIIEIPDDLVKKQSRLNFEEYEELKQHCERSEELIKDLDCYEKIKAMIRHHHENVNGYGYPDCLEGDEIPLGAKIIHIAEAFDSMTNARKNRQNIFSKQRALHELKEYQGRMYDTDVLAKYLEILDNPADQSPEPDTNTETESET